MASRRGRPANTNLKVPSPPYRGFGLLLGSPYRTLGIGIRDPGFSMEGSEHDSTSNVEWLAFDDLCGVLALQEVGSLRVRDGGSLAA